MLELKNISFKYKNDTSKTIIDDFNYKFDKGCFYSITGKSGSGKTTLLSILAGLDGPNSGEVLFDQKNIKKIGYSKYRKDIISLVFQNYNLIDYMTAKENLEVVNKNADPQILIDLGLDEDMIDRNVMQLSGGQQQRVAIARALSKNTPIILMDEPTGNLDKKNEKEIIKIIKKIAKEKCVIVVTHSPEMAKQSDIRIKL